MFDPEFFPTPVDVITRMVAPFRLENSRYNYTGLRYKPPILDPNGGSGAILDYLKDELRVRQSDLLTIELNPELRYMLQGKGYRVIGTDFLTYDEPVKFGMILMNPPFSQGAKHVLKAWDLLADGGELVALVNRETTENPFSEERKLLGRLIEQHGSVEDLGQCFQDAERKTDVAVSLIRMSKPERESSVGFDGIGFDVDPETFATEFAANPLAHRDAIANLVIRFNTARDILIQRYEQQSKLDFYLQGIPSAVHDSVDQEKEKALEQRVRLPDQLSVLKSRFWNAVFTQTKMGARTTSHFREKFSDFSKCQAAMAFTEDNVREVLGMFFLNQAEIMKECLVQVFDKSTAYHEKNRVHTEGWKTNKSWKLNRRIIMPNAVCYSDLMGFSGVYHRRDYLTDLDKVCCWLTGTQFEEISTTYDALYSHTNSRTVHYSEPFESTFFNLRVFKKGTLHIDFKDLEMLAKFNRVAAEGKNWLGDGT